MLVVCGMQTEGCEEVLGAGEETLGLGKSYSGGQSSGSRAANGYIPMGGGKKMAGASWVTEDGPATALRPSTPSMATNTDEIDEIRDTGCSDP
jgi:hypothetical protein